MELRTYLRILVEKWWIVLLVFLVTFGVTIWLTFTQSPEYQATASFIVRPNLSSDDAKNLLSGLDVLSRRAEIASTYAEVANSRLIKERAAQQLGLSSALQRRVSVNSQLVAGTNVLELTAIASDPTLAKVFADAVGNQTVVYVQELYEPYQLTPLDQAALPKSPVKPNKALNLVLGAVLGLILGAGMALLVYYLQTPAEQTASQGIADDETDADKDG